MTLPEGADVSDDMGIEIAHRLSEREERNAPRRESKVFRALEVLEVLLLAFVAIATAWAGYQASKWEGRQALLYGTASAQRFEADAATITADTTLSTNVQLLTSWLGFSSQKNTDAANLIARRFTPDYAASFNKWILLDPLHNSLAPPGPAAMPGFVNADQVKADTLNAAAQVSFDTGSAAREVADKYVRNTVLFASVMFLIAIAQRLRRHELRTGVIGVAAVLLVFVVLSLVSLPRM